jgi:hypothetical protein
MVLVNRNHDGDDGKLAMKLATSAIASWICSLFNRNGTASVNDPTIHSIRITPFLEDLFISILNFLGGGYTQTENTVHIHYLFLKTEVHIKILIRSKRLRTLVRRS